MTRGRRPRRSTPRACSCEFSIASRQGSSERPSRSGSSFAARAAGAACSLSALGSHFAREAVTGSVVGQPRLTAAVGHHRRQLASARSVAKAQSDSEDRWMTKAIAAPLLAAASGPGLTPRLPRSGTGRARGDSGSLSFQSGYRGLCGGRGLSRAARSRQHRSRRSRAAAP